MEPKRCDKCGKESVLFQKYSGQHLCRVHFVADLESKAKRAIRTHHWLRTGDHIAVAFTGDSATSALLYFLKKLTAKRRDIRISAICIDEGIAGFHDLTEVKDITRLLGADCFSESFYHEYGITMAEIVQQKSPADACQYCRVLRHQLLNRIARENGITKLALGSSLDDGARDVLSDVLCGNAEHLIVAHRTITGVVPRIRPFMDVPAQEIRLYAALLCGDRDAGDYLSAACPYSASARELDIHALLDEYTLNHPATKHALVNLRENLSGTPCEAAGNIPVCACCGEPGTSTCGNCGILDEFSREIT
jgi:tRNA(Ile)-lysidine synthase TilS/MesJ